MSDAASSQNSFADGSREAIMSAHFANLVLQQTNMTLMLLGKAPHPETGETMQDIEAARMFIDQLEMLECKTKGNLTKDEQGLLQQSLMAVRMAFVEAADTAGKTPSQQEQPAAPSQPAEAGMAGKAAPSPAPSSGTEEEPKKKFTKKY
jgi:hypothetical protein